MAGEAGFAEPDEPSDAGRWLLLIDVGYHNRAVAQPEILACPISRLSAVRPTLL